MSTLPQDADPRHASARQAAIAALAGLALLSTAMFVAAMAGVPPHPPADKLPFVSVNAALAVAGLLLLQARHAAGPSLALLAALAYLPTVGPHKFWTEAQAAALAPVIVAGTAAVLTLAWAALRLMRLRAARTG